MTDPAESDIPQIAESDLSTDDRLSENEETEDRVRIAPIPARCLAAFLDYLLLSALSMSMLVPSLGYDQNFVVILLLSFLYFTLCNSEWMKGQTLGKRAFGLRVVAVGANSKTYLSLAQSAFRYLASFGAVILVAELPPLYLRAQGAVFTPFWGEFNMLLSMVLTISCVFLILFTKSRQGIHDLLTKSVVVRGIVPSEASGSFTTPMDHGKVLKLILPGAVLLASILWGLGHVQPKAIGKIKEHKFLLEHTFPLRIQQLRISEQQLYFDAVLLKQGSELEALSQEEIAARVTEYLKSRDIIEEGSLNAIIFQFYEWVDGKIIRPEPISESGQQELKKGGIFGAGLRGESGIKVNLRNNEELT